MRLLDLYCGAGGATAGYERAGFHVHGVDLQRVRGYPALLFVDDACRFLEAHGHEYDAIHASPPCQAHTKLQVIAKNDHPELVGPTREILETFDVPWVIENVPGAPLKNPQMLCGTMFDLGASGLQLRRHRHFESNIMLYAPCACRHDGHSIGIYGHGGVEKENGQNGKRSRQYEGYLDEWQEAMQMPWATKAGIAQAIPPAFTEWIGNLLRRNL